MVQGEYMIYLVKSPNSLVVDNNFTILEEAIKKVSPDICVLNSGNYLHTKYIKDSIIITGCLDYAFKLIVKGHKNVCAWVQGIAPEESYLRNKSKIRYKILSRIEKYTLKRLKYVLFVSDAMREHYEKKYSLRFESYDVFPCFNTKIHVDAFKNDKNKYKNNVFVYAGGTAKWQGLDAIVEAYSKIEKLIENSKFLFLTNDFKVAQELAKKYQLINYEVDYVKKEELPSKLSLCKFGFVLRENILVNNVSTPTKLSTYLSCGVIPIFSASIRDFTRVMENKKYKVVFTPTSFIDKIEMLKEVDLNEILNEYSEIFSSYYSNDHYATIISKRIQELMGK